MGVDKIYDVRWLRSQPTQGGYTPDKIDAENGIIRDVVMVEQGEAKGHNVHLDSDFIRQLVAYDNKVYGDRGLKARFGHPQASNETMGTQMGTFKNIRERKIAGKMQAIGDLHLLDAAEFSPTHPGMRSWMLKMAEEQPDFVMSSIVFQASGYYQRKANGHKRYLTSEDDADSELGEVWVEFGEKGQHLYTDMVEAGAATNNLFSNQVNPNLFVAQADEFLASHPNIKAFIQAHPEKVVAFFDSVGISLTQQRKMSKLNLFQWLTGESSGEADTDDLASLRTSLAEAQTSVTALNAAKVAAENRVKELETNEASLQTSLRDLNETVKGLNAQLESVQKEVEELKQKAADVHSGGDTDQSVERAYHKTPIYQPFRKK